MRELALRSALTPFVRSSAEAICREAASRSEQEHALALRAWMDDHTQFLRDPMHAELVKDPIAMLNECWRRQYALGDCDDVATMGAALGSSIGLIPRFVVLAFGTPDAPWTHVFTELLPSSGDENQAVDLDITRVAQNLPFGISRTQVFTF